MAVEWMKTSRSKFANRPKLSRDLILDKPPPGTYRIHYDYDGNLFVKTVKGPFDQPLILEGQTETTKIVMDELYTFWQSKEKYKELGLTFKRGILIYGIPGCGKTMLTQRIRNEIVANGGYVFPITNPASQIGEVRDFRNHLSKKNRKNFQGVIVAEDIDRWDEAHMAHLLDALDGQNSMPAGIVFIGTTNHIDRLPDRLVNRPSRIDRLIEMSAPSEETRMSYLTQISANASELKKNSPIIGEIVDITEGLSLAQVKEVFIAYYIHGEPVEKGNDRVRGRMPTSVAITETAEESTLVN